MLITFDELQGLPETTINNLIREYLLTQVEDLSFDNLDNQILENAIESCRNQLKVGALIVEYSEENQSIAIRDSSVITQTK